MNPDAYEGYPVPASYKTPAVLLIYDLFHVLEDGTLVNTSYFW